MNIQTGLFAIAVVGIAIVHFITSFFTAFAAGISAPGESPFLQIVSQILTFPLWLIPNDFALPEPLGLLPWFLLSLCWGLAICFGARMLLGGTR